MVETSSQERKDRIRRLKRIIIFLLIAAICVPVVLSVILFIRLHSMSSELDELKQKIGQMEQTREADKRTTIATEELADILGSIYSAVPGEDIIEIPETVESNYRKVYLTFDDGPSENTGEILDILKQYDVKATFFVVAKESERYNESYQRIVDEGHTLGMHSYSHKYDEIYASLDNYEADFTKLEEFLSQKTGVVPKFCRFPGGSSNTVSQVDMRELIAYLNDEDITYFDWNIESGDTTSGKISAEELVDNCMSKLERYHTAMILMHDAADKDTTVEALPALIENILAMEDTEILPISEETVPIQHITKGS